MSLGVLTLYLEVPGCASLKEKRRRLKPLLSRLHREFNISVAEIDRQDSWKAAVIACALVSSDPIHTQRLLQQVAHWVETSWPDLSLVDEQIELL
jgi:uncharacterized protein YlxP (DUF503 family)